jgi:hypothetical protein
MTTKKQRREAGELQAKIDAEESRLSGLRAQRMGTDRLANLRRTQESEVDKINQRHKEILGLDGHISGE